MENKGLSEFLIFNNNDSFRNNAPEPLRLEPAETNITPSNIAPEPLRLEPTEGNFIVLNNTPEPLRLQPTEHNITDGRTYMWTRENTLKLLDLYRKYRGQVGTFQIRNFKKMWEIISLELRKKYNLIVSPSNCENKWRVLERNYKKYIDNKNQTGGGRPFFEYFDEMDSILGKKKNIKPTVVLSTATISQPPVEMEVECSTSREAKENEPSLKTEKKTKTSINRPERIRKSHDTMERIRKDKEERHKDRMNFEKMKFEKLYELEKDKQAIKKEKNQILRENNDLNRERNDILKKCLDNKLTVNLI